MHVISKRTFNDAAKKYPNEAQAIDDLYRLLNSNIFSSPDEMRKIVKSLDNFKYKDRWWVIDIGGNKLRMIAFIEFRHNRLFVKHIVNHADYDKLTKRYRQGDL